MKILKNGSITFYFDVDEETADEFDDVAQDIVLFPSANYRSKAIEMIANIAPGDDPELKVDSPKKSDKPKP